MAEVGCLKDGNFQNLETKVLEVNGNALKVSGYVTIGGTAAGSTTFGTVHDVAFGRALTKNAVHIINGAAAANATTIITLPTAAQISSYGIEVGDFYTFVVGVSAASAGHVIKLDAAPSNGAGGYMIGNIRLVRGLLGAADAASGVSVAGELSAVYAVYGTDEKISMISGGDPANGGREGSYVTCRYIGSLGLLTSGGNPHWLISGEVITDIAASTGADIFATI